MNTQQRLHQLEQATTDKDTDLSDLIVVVRADEYVEGAYSDNQLVIITPVTV